MVPEACKQLLEKGEVFTFRWHRRKQTGRDWANRKRGGKKIANVFIDEPRLIETRSDLDIYFKVGCVNAWEGGTMVNNHQCPECGNDMWIAVTESKTYHCIKCDKSYRMTENGLKEKTIIGKRFRP